MPCMCYSAGASHIKCTNVAAQCDTFVAVLMPVVGCSGWMARQARSGMLSTMQLTAHHTKSLWYSVQRTSGVKSLTGANQFSLQLLYRHAAEVLSWYKGIRCVVHGRHAGG